MSTTLISPFPLINSADAEKAALIAEEDSTQTSPPSSSISALTIPYTGTVKSATLLKTTHLCVLLPQTRIATSHSQWAMRMVTIASMQHAEPLLRSI